MIVVVVAAETTDSLFWNTAYSLLHANYAVTSVREGVLNAPVGTSDLLLADATSLRSLECETAVIVYKEAISLETKIQAKNEVIAVVDSCNRELLPFVGKTGLNAITCGLSARDSVTLSSMGVDSAVINLQRSMTCFDGGVLEPQEIPLQLEAPVDDFALMAASAVYLLTGRKHQLYHTFFSD